MAKGESCVKAGWASIIGGGSIDVKKNEVLSDTKYVIL